MAKFSLKAFAKILAQVAPIAMAAAGVPPEITSKVQHLMVLAENRPGAEGPAKKAYVLDGIKTGAGLADDLVHPDVDDVNEDQLTDAVSKGIDATIAMVNTVKNIPVKG